MFQQYRRRSAAVIAILAGTLPFLTGCTSASPGPLAPSPIDGSVLSFISSDPRDHVGRGQSLTFTSPSNVFVGQMTDGNRQLKIAVSVGNGFLWNLFLAAPPGRQLRPGRYLQATSLPYETAQVALSGDGRACGQNGVGELEVLAADYGPGQPATSADPAISGTIVRFHARFTQRCSPTAPPLTGEVSVQNLPRVGSIILR